MENVGEHESAEIARLDARVDRLEQDHRGVRESLRRIYTQRDGDRESARKDADARQRALLAAIEKAETTLSGKIDSVNGTVRRHDADIQTMKARNAAAPVAKVAAKVPDKVQWAAAGGIGISGLLYIVQKLAEALATLADKLPSGGLP